MLDGFVTLDELIIITGLPKSILRALLLLGMKHHEIHVSDGVQGERTKLLHKQLFSLKEVEHWLRAHIF